VIVTDIYFEADIDGKSEIKPETDKPSPFARSVKLGSTSSSITVLIEMHGLPSQFPSGQDADKI
jgi:hypothetical protein